MRTMSAQQARANFGDVLGSVYYTKEPVMVQKKGKPVAVMISPEAFAQIERQHKRSWQTVDRIRERNATKDPDAELAFITDVVEEVRDERYAATQRKTEGRR